jgi:predicted O-methyltransferase YrrM
MLLAAPRLTRRGDPGSSALARILVATALDRTPDAERIWLERIEERRGGLAENTSEISGEYGAGPDIESGRWVRSEAKIGINVGVALMSITALWGRFLLKLVHGLAPGSALELGTAFGISTSFQAAGLELNGRGRLITLDAAADWGEVAQQGLAELGLEGRVERRVGWIDETLEAALADGAPIDFAFVDAEHQGTPTIRYFERMLPHLAPRAVIVLDDIAFDREMRSAWATLRRHPRVDRGLDLGRMGLIALR